MCCVVQPDVHPSYICSNISPATSLYGRLHSHRVHNRNLSLNKLHNLSSLNFKEIIFFFRYLCKEIQDHKSIKALISCSCVCIYYSNIVHYTIIVQVKCSLYSVQCTPTTIDNLLYNYDISQEQMTVHHYQHPV